MRWLRRLLRKIPDYVILVGEPYKRGGPGSRCQSCDEPLSTVAFMRAVPGGLLVNCPNCHGWEFWLHNCHKERPSESVVKHCNEQFMRWYSGRRI
jgi:hypothetical protein